MSEPGFGARLAAAIADRGPLCLGIDPHPELLRSWDLPVSADGLVRFSEICVQAFAGFAIVTFIALLDLYRRLVIELAQDELFGEIVIRRKAAAMQSRDTSSGEAGA